VLLAPERASPPPPQLTVAEMAASNKMLFVFLGLVFCTWAISLAGLSSSQRACLHFQSGAAALDGVQAFSGSVLSCGKVYRYWWFVVSLELVVIIALIVVAATGALRSQRASWIGVMSVATVLYISMTEAFYTAEATDEARANGELGPRGRTSTAGALMTALMNCVIIISLGTKSEESDGAKAKADI